MIHAELLVELENSPRNGDRELQQPLFIWKCANPTETEGKKQSGLELIFPVADFLLARTAQHVLLDTILYWSIWSVPDSKQPGGRRVLKPFEYRLWNNVAFLEITNILA